MSNYNWHSMRSWAGNTRGGAAHRPVVWIGAFERKRPDPPACPSKTVTSEVADYCLPSQFGRTGQQAKRGQAFTTSHGAVAATPRTASIVLSCASWEMHCQPDLGATSRPT